MGKIVAIESFSFAYPKSERNVLNDINLQIEQSEFVVVCGTSGCGKTTLLRNLKPALTPKGTKNGNIFFEDKPLSQLSQREGAEKIGFVMQCPENQIVTDKVWHELAFGLESLGLDRSSIRLRVAEMASFLGIQNWFHRDVDELSGGQKQLLALGSVMVLQPSLLILDEPTSQLDPIAAGEFLAALGKINRELGVSVLLSEHRLEEALPLANRAVVMDDGKILCEGTPAQVGQKLKEHPMFRAMPVPMRIYQGLMSEDAGDEVCPVTVAEGRKWLERVAENQKRNVINSRRTASTDLPPESTRLKIPFAAQLEEVSFRYEREGEDVIRGLSFAARYGELTALLGGNGTGKTTALSLIAGLNRPHRGKVRVDGRPLEKIPRPFEGLLGVVPQNPQTLFVENTLGEDLAEVLTGLTAEEKAQKVAEIAQLCRLSSLLNSHPYDLSGGEQQRAALAKVLLMEPQILLLDEPTKGIDADFKAVFAGILAKLTQAGKAIIMVSHDIEFCAEYADRCALFFDGGIVTENTPRAFFSGNSFYTTAANRMARHHLPQAVTVGDVIEGLQDTGLQDSGFRVQDSGCQEGGFRREARISAPKPSILTPVISFLTPEFRRIVGVLSVIFLTIPLTIFVGMEYLDDRKYYLISLLVIIQAMLPFVLIFEGRRPKARELVIIAVLCAIGVAGRAAFFMLPQFKPVLALVIIAGAALGSETGFFVGAMTMFLSNMFFGQGPMTPWQMFAAGLIGFLAGVIFKRRTTARAATEDKKIGRWGVFALCVFGFLSTFAVYGGLMNAASMLTFQPSPTWEMLIPYYVQGLPFDLLHAAATVFFLLLAARPILKKLARVQGKYSLLT
ncbi:MAG: ATP-binding cassette domain-containing protein [Oscillospiraceae bacterium]|nr:ATP-binding cassette domain-containing protein [Oscillospiraceae bacterium]